jgi:hypothetical protein
MTLKGSLPDRDVSAHTEIGWVEDLVSGWVGKDSLGVNTGLVGECTESSDVVVAIISSFQYPANGSVQRNRDLDGFGDEILDFSEHGEIVLGLDVFWVGDHHSCNQTTKGCDTVSFSDTELSSVLNPRGLEGTYNGGIDVSSTSLKSSVSIGNSYHQLIALSSNEITHHNRYRYGNESRYHS